MPCPMRVHFFCLFTGAGIDLKLCSVRITDSVRLNVFSRRTRSCDAGGPPPNVASELVSDDVSIAVGRAESPALCVFTFSYRLSISAEIHAALCSVRTTDSVRLNVFSRRTRSCDATGPPPNVASEMVSDDASARRQPGQGPRHGGVSQAQQALCLRPMSLPFRRPARQD
jgi:hypothetical protein